MRIESRRPPLAQWIVVLAMALLLLPSVGR